MATCQGNIPLTTKVDESTRDLVDELADDTGVSRSEVLRRLLEVYHHSSEGKLECPSCKQSTRIRVDDVGLSNVESGEVAMTDRSTDSECRDDGVPDEETDTETGTNSPGGGSRITKLESIVEDQQQELEFLRSKMIAQEEDLANLSEGSVPLQRIDQLEERIGWLGDEVRNAIPRIAALTEVSDLSDSGVCPRCDGELTVRTSFTDVSSPSAIECPDCDLVVGHRM